ncbi:hypothetical protein C8250_042825 [Streptomyces sp. So13.3]|uniref:hypothetical protein n=1 Tax=Streptomyces sp. So13.3 TaxID=2136173 RepID=UPI00164EBB24|nr:hypothetical protein [Streptomyces sp. So13.3]QNA77607.1 hypothetical protein C8250_042825 [Streptomyces sp. So13.3]
MVLLIVATAAVGTVAMHLLLGCGWRGAAELAATVTAGVAGSLVPYWAGWSGRRR